MNLKKLLLTSILINGLLLSSCDLSDDNNSSSISLKEGYRSLFLDESTNGVVVKGDLNHSYKVGSEVGFSIIDQDDVDEEVYINNKKLSPYLEESINGINYIDYVFEMPDEDVVISCVLNKHVPLNEIYPFIDELSVDSIKEVYYNDYYVAVVDQISSVKYTNNKSDFNTLIKMLKNCYAVKDDDFRGFPPPGGHASYLDIYLLDDTVESILINNSYIIKVDEYSGYSIRNYRVNFEFGEFYKCFLPPAISHDEVYFNYKYLDEIENLVDEVMFTECDFELGEKFYLVKSQYNGEIKVYDKNHFVYQDQKYKTVGNKDFSILFSKFNYI